LAAALAAFQREDRMSQDQKGQPPQHQEKQPGLETQMDPAPDYAPRFPGSGRLEGKVALVTGGDSGIGRAVSVLFAREGAKVAIVYLEEDGDAQDTEGLIRAEGSEALLIRGDVGGKSFCENAVEQTVKRFGGLDVLVNNAAEQHTATDLAEITEEQLEETFRTNIFGYFFMAQAALKHMKEGAAIINTTSVTAYKGNPPTGGLLLNQGSNRGLHPRPLWTAGRKEHSRERGRARADLDAADSRRHFRRRRWRASAQTCRSAVPASQMRSRRRFCFSPARIRPTSAARSCIPTVAPCSIPEYGAAGGSGVQLASLDSRQPWRSSVCGNFRSRRFWRLSSRFCL
jgi:NAD(P)-dependent dehydrogenase (short-subunit alcohol dehydrogenase family)